MIVNDYLDRGWVVVPIAQGQKAPRGAEAKQWPSWRLNKTQAAIEFLRKPNIGVHLGPSGLVDIDLDCEEARELAAEYLPETSTFGRAGNPRSHWIFHAPIKGTLPYKKFVDPTPGGGCLLEIRTGEGFQSVFPGSTHPSGERIEWSEGEGESFETIVDAEEFYEDVCRLAVAAWCAKHPGEAIPPKVLQWSQGVAQFAEIVEREAAKPGSLASQFKKEPAKYEGRDPELVESIIEDCPPKGSRHDYRLSVAGAMQRAGIAEQSAADMLAEAMADPRIGGSVEDAHAAVRDSYNTTRNTTGAGTLIEQFEGRKTVNKIEALTTPSLDTPDPKLDGWLDRLYETALGGNVEVLEDAEIKNGLARMLLSKDSRLPVIWARLRDGGYKYTKELREATEYRMKEIRQSIDVGEALPAKHPEAQGMQLPPGYRVDEGVLKLGDELVLNGELELLGKCPGLEGTQARFAFRSPSNKKWTCSVAPYRSLVSTKDVLVLAEHGCNVSSLEAPAIVAFVRDYVGHNEKKLDRPIATQTGWHDTGAFVWGRNVLNGPKDLQAEYPADNQIALGYVNALHSKGTEAAEFEALRQVVEELPTAALCVAASLAACQTHRLKRPTIGVHLAGMGGRGKTRTLKIAGSVWGATGASGGLSGQGTLAGANSTQRALEIAAGARNDLPFLVSDVRPFPGLTEVLHAVLNGDPRARATQRGGSTVGAPYRAGAVITEGELNVLSLTTRQGFHRRMLELEPDEQTQKLWDLGSALSENYGHLGPKFALSGPLDQARLDYWEESCKGLLGHDAAINAASLLATCEQAAKLLGANSTTWCANVFKALQADAGERSQEGATQAERVEDDLAEILVDLAPQIADTQEGTRLNESPRPWLGYRTDKGVIIRAQILIDLLRKRGHDAIKDAINALVHSQHIVRAEKRQHMIAGVRVRCYEIRTKQTEGPL